MGTFPCVMMYAISLNIFPFLENIEYAHNIFLFPFDSLLLYYSIVFIFFQHNTTLASKKTEQRFSLFGLMLFVTKLP